MLDKISSDIKEAMKAQDKERLSALRYLKSMLIENKTSSNPKAEQDVAIALAKKLKDSIEIYPEGHPSRAQIEKEVSFLAPYLPASVGEAEVEAIIKEIVGRLEKPNAGLIMKELSPQIKGRFDGKKASEMVKKILEG